jgi:hypothetical protein
MISLSGKKGLVVGIANEHSIAYGCAKAFLAAGAELRLQGYISRSFTLGELVQIDGSEHAWFEDLACSLLVYIDDATSGLMGTSMTRLSCGCCCISRTSNQRSAILRR